MSDVSTVGTVGVLESRYRRLLALLPAAYREQRAEEMVGMLLDGAAEQQRWPRPAEVASVAGLSVRLRTGAPGGSGRAATFGEVLQRLALAGLVVQMLFYAADFCESVISYAQWSGPVESSFPAVCYIAADGAVSALSAAALVCLVRGGRRAGGVLAAVSTVMVCAEIGVGLATAGSIELLFPAELVVSLTAPLAVSLLCTAAVLLGFHRDTPDVVAPGRWLRVMAVSLLIVLACSGGAQVLDGRADLMPPAAATWLGAVAHLIVAPIAPAVAILFGLSRAGRPVIWSTGLLLLSIPVIGLAVDFAILLFDRMPLAELRLSVGPGLLAESPAELDWEALVTLSILAVASWSAIRRRGRLGTAALAHS